jgi:hypothetical protein
MPYNQLIRVSRSPFFLSVARYYKDQAMFGLPFSTTFVAFGVPVLIILALICWGMWFPRRDMDDPDAPEDSEQ